MIRGGMSSAEFRRYAAGLTQPHRVRYRVELLDLDGRFVADLSDNLTGGQVDIDTTAEVTRRATINLDRMDAAEGLADEEPRYGVAFANRMVRVHYQIRQDDWDRWASIPVFTGPITQMDREDHVVNLTCQGKEFLLSRPGWRTLTYPKGNTTSGVAIRLLKAFGESAIHWPDSKTKITAPISLVRDSKPWEVVQRLAKAQGGVAYYDGAGVCRFVRLDKTIAWTFRTGDGGSLVSAPSMSYSLDDMFNVVTVVGGVPPKAKGSTVKGSAKPVTWTAVAPEKHPLSPRSMRRAGVDTIIGLRIQNTAITKQDDAKKLAISTLNNSLRSSVDLSFESLPIPHLEPHDMVRVAADGYVYDMRMVKATIPLTAGGTMSVGRTYKTGIRR